MSGTKFENGSPTSFLVPKMRIFGPGTGGRFRNILERTAIEL